MPIEVTVFTPTYNRAHTLTRTFESLLQQTFTSFEWLIVDDGSTDGTEELTSSWKARSLHFPIRYLWKENGGKHTAHNLGVREARGRFFAILDSDDWYLPEALTMLTKHWGQIGKNKQQFANVEGLTCYKDGMLVGSPYPSDIFDSDNFQILHQRSRHGDTLGMYRTDVLREFPFPDGYEKIFVTEGLVWNRIANKYKTRFVNEIIGIKEYQAGGLSDCGMRENLKCAGLFADYFGEMLASKHRLPFKKRLQYCSHFVRYLMHSHRQSGMALIKERSLLLLGIPVGCALYLIDKAKTTCT